MFGSRYFSAWLLLAFSLQSSMAIDYQKLLQSQFDPLTGYSVHKSEFHEWYKMSVDFDNDRINNEWNRIHQANILLPQLMGHNFQLVNLSFPFLFFGGSVNQLVISSAGGVFTHPDMESYLPNYVAPFLNLLPDSARDKVLYVDQGSAFYVQWEKSVDGDDHHKLVFRLKIYPHGMIRFMYDNLGSWTSEAISQRRTPLLIGLKDTFSASSTDVYEYPEVSVNLEDLLTSKSRAMITFELKPLCSSLKKESCDGPCTFCQQEFCAFKFEPLRPNSNCQSRTDDSKGEDVDCEYNCDASPGQTVCGSDGITYSNECLLKYTACSTNSNISVSFASSCHHVTSNSSCNITCLDSNAMVCGSDGHVYKNECILRRLNCIEGKNVSISPQENCDSKHDYDYKVDISASNSTFDDDYEADTSITEHSQDTNCQINCTGLVSPVCLNSRFQYASVCHLKVDNCAKHSKVYNVTQGFCLGRQTVRKTKQPKEPPGCQEVIGCPVVNRPVCGSNNLTYENECVVRQINCFEKLNISIVKQGPCEQQQSTECPKICNKILLPVCGTNGKTYSNKCLLKHDSCLDSSIQLDYEGRCREDPVPQESAFNVPFNVMPSEEVQLQDEKRIASEHNQLLRFSSNLIGAAGLLLFFCLLIGLFVMSRRSKVKKQMKMMNNKSASLDSWIYINDVSTKNNRPSSAKHVELSVIDKHKSADMKTTTTTFAFKNDKLPLVDNIVLQDD